MSKVLSLAAMLPAAMLASAEIVSVPLTAQEGVVGKSKSAGSYYSMDVTVGTPGQTVPVKFDTASSELWVNPECATSSNPTACAAKERFTESTTLDVIEGEVGSVGGAEVQYATDYVRVGSATITQQIFGLGQSSKDAVVGVFGAGPQVSGWDSGFPLAIDSLASQELIGGRVFSLDLKEQGSVIFGGLDTKKYSGQLAKLAVVPGPNGKAGWFVNLNGISVKKADGTVANVYSGEGQVVLLDSGSALSTLPPTIFASLLAAFPTATLDPATGLHTVDCNGRAGSIEFTFGEKVIEVPVSDFVVKVPGSETCVLGAYEAESAVLGTDFLQSAYTVFDFDGKAVHLAQAADCGSNLVAIDGAVPSVEGCSALARRLSKVIEPETNPEDDSDWCEDDSDDEDEDDEEWCEDDDEDGPNHTRNPTNTHIATGTNTHGGHTGTRTATNTHGPTGTGTNTRAGHTGTRTATNTHGSTGTNTRGPTGSQTTHGGSHPTGDDHTYGGSHPTGDDHTHGGSHPTGDDHTHDGPHPTGDDHTHDGPRPTGGHGGHGGPITRQTLTHTQYSTFTVTSCAPTITNCHAGNVVTQVITRTTEVCPETTGVYTRHRDGKDYPFTVRPVEPRPTPVVVPGCTPGAPRPTGSWSSGGDGHGSGSGSWTPGSGSGSWTPGSGSGAPGSGSWTPGSGSGAPGSGSGSWTPGSGSGAPGSGSGSWTPGSGSGAPGSGSGSWTPGSGSGAPGSGSGSWTPGSGSGAPGSGSGSWAPGSGSGAPGSGSGSWAPGSGSGAPGSGSGSWAPGSGSGAPGSGAPGAGSGAPGAGSGSGAHGAGSGAGAGSGSATTLVHASPTGTSGGPGFGGPAGGNGTTSGLKPVVTAGASRMSWTVAAFVGAFVAGVMAL